MFATATVGAAVFAAVVAALRSEEIKVVSPLADSRDAEPQKRPKAQAGEKGA